MPWEAVGKEVCAKDVREGRLARLYTVEHIAHGLQSHARPARCMADMSWCRLCSRMASSTASTKALTKAAGFPIP